MVLRLMARLPFCLRRASPSRPRGPDRRFRRVAPELAVDVERALDADCVEILFEPGLGVLAAEVAQLLQEGPGRVYRGRGGVTFELAGAADAMEAFETKVLDLQRARADEAGEEVGRAQFRQKDRVESDFVDAIGDLLGRPWRLGPLGRVDLHDDRVAASRLLKQAPQRRIA